MGCWGLGKFRAIAVRVEGLGLAVFMGSHVAKARTSTGALLEKQRATGHVESGLSGSVRRLSVDDSAERYGT